jgi:hypothetical protein
MLDSLTGLALQSPVPVNVLPRQLEQRALSDHRGFWLACPFRQ